MTNPLIALWPYADLFWLPVLVWSAGRKHWFVSLFYGVAGAVLMRLIIDFATDSGYGRGVLGLWNWTLFERGLLIFSLIHLVYCVSARYTRGRGRALFLVGSLSFLFLASVLFALATVL